MKTKNLLKYGIAVAATVLLNSCVGAWWDVSVSSPYDYVNPVPPPPPYYSPTYRPVFIPGINIGGPIVGGPGPVINVRPNRPPFIIGGFTPGNNGFRPGNSVNTNGGTNGIPKLEGQRRGAD